MGFSHLMSMGTVDNNSINDSATYNNIKNRGRFYKKCYMPSFNIAKNIIYLTLTFTWEAQW